MSNDSICITLHDYSLDENARLGSRRARGRGRRTNVVGDDVVGGETLEEIEVEVVEIVGTVVGENVDFVVVVGTGTGSVGVCLLYTSPSPRDRSLSRMPSSA